MRTKSGITAGTAPSPPDSCAGSSASDSRRCPPPCRTFIRAACAITCREAPWEVEAREKKENSGAAKHSEKLQSTSHHGGADVDDREPASPSSHQPKDTGLTELALPDDAAVSDDASDDAEREAEEAEDVFFKRAMTGVGVAAVYLSWVRARAPMRRRSALTLFPLFFFSSPCSRGLYSRAFLRGAACGNIARALTEPPSRAGTE